MTGIVVDAALDEPFELLGKLIEASGQEDSSGYRRSLVSRLARKDFEGVGRALGIPAAKAEELRDAFVKAWGEPE
jgi:hypothetical protein